MYFTLKNDSQTHADQNRGVVCSVCVLRTRDNVRLKALILENVLHTHMMGVKSLENFLETLEGQVFHLLSDENI